VAAVVPHLNVAGKAVGYEQVQPAVAVGVGEGDGGGVGPDRHLGETGEGFVAQAEVDGERTGAGVANDEVPVAVTVEIGTLDLGRQRAGGQGAVETEAAWKVLVEGDRGATGVDGGDEGGAVPGEGDGVVGGAPWIDEQGRGKGAWLAGTALAPEHV